MKLDERTEFELVTLGDVASVVSGYAFNSSEFSSNGVPVVKIANIRVGFVDMTAAQCVPEDNLRRLNPKFQIRPCDILVSLTGSQITQPNSVVGRVARQSHSAPLALLNQRAGKVIINRPDRCDAGFLYWTLVGRDTRQKIAAMAHGAASQANVSPAQVESLKIRLPALKVQRGIASLLTAYDDLIENNTRRIAILEEMGRQIYEEWFVHFRFPGHEHVRMVASAVGLVPEGWPVGSVADVAVVHRGRSYKGSELADLGGRPFINLKCIARDGGFRSSGLKRYTGEFKESQTVRASEMVMGITDMTQERRIVARVGRVPLLDQDFGVFSMDLVRVASRGVFPEPYLYAMFRWSGFADEVKQHANGANVLHLLPARIEEYCFARPSPELATRFANVMAPMLSLCDALEQKNNNLRTTRDLLLPKLISGELDVSPLPEPEALAA